MARILIGIFIVYSLQNKLCLGENLSFPDGFSIGCATASYQIEGAWNISDKGENVWDRFTHEKPWLIADRSNGDIACNSYDKYREDIQLLKDIGVDHYRISLSWSRILPGGFSNKISKSGLEYYHNIIDNLRENNIEPFVTIYHWDHPQILEDMGGWTNELMTEWFRDYANVVFTEFAPKVKYWATINEPSVFCIDGYEGLGKAPGKILSGIGRYICMHNVLKAHAMAYRLYDEKFRPQYKGKVSIVVPCLGFFPSNETDVTSQDIGYQFLCGWIAHPIFSESGDYPEVMKTRIAENSKLEGHPKSRLPEFSTEWINFIRGTADYFGLNHYTTRLTESVEKGNSTGWFQDSGVKFSVDPRWPKCASNWLRPVPEGFGWILNKIKSEYKNPPVYIMENGISDNGEIEDHQRLEYLYSYMKAMLNAIHNDGCNVKAYTLWSILDNFEWERGYTEKFGIVQVDFANPDRNRTLKRSAHWFKRVISERRLLPIDDNINTTLV